MAPRLIVHLGLSTRGGVALEAVARNGPYTQPDVTGQLLGANVQSGTGDGVALVGAPAVLESPLDLAAVAAAVGHPEVAVSREAGLYVCEFTLFRSLARNAAPAFFVHVPPFDDAEHTPEVGGPPGCSRPRP